MNIYQSIKQACIKSIKIPAVFVILCMAVLTICPFLNVFHPTRVSDIYHIENDDNYVEAVIPTLSYSGYDLVGTIGQKYGYYYALDDHQCVFVLIPISDYPAATIHDYKFRGKVTGYGSMGSQMLSSFARDLNWDKASLMETAPDYLLNEAEYHPVVYMIVFWIVLIIFFISLKSVIQCIIGYLNPNLYPVCSFLGKEIQQELLTEAQEELSKGPYIQINQMYITENYFIDLGAKKISVIPLSDIIWCYRLGTLSLNPRNHDHNYSIHFTIRSGTVITISNKTSDEALELINAIRATEYDIIIGHSEAKKKAAKKRIRS